MNQHARTALFSKFWVWIALAVVSVNATASFFSQEQTTDNLLPAEEAFVPSAFINGQGQLQANWYIANDYYLYRHQFKLVVLSGSVTLGQLNIPDGLAKHDAAFGDVEVYYRSVDISAPITAGSGNFEVEVHYQGCAEIGLCYPPQTSVFALTVDSPSSGQASPETSHTPTNNPAANSEALAPASQQGDGSQRLADTLNRSPVWAILVFAGLGILLSFNPCSYPMYPILSRIIVGQGDIITKTRGVSLSLAYVIPMAMMYALAGALIALLGQNLFAAFQSPLWLGTVIVILLLLSLSMFGAYELQLPASLQTKLNRLSEQQQSGSYWGAAIMGALSALVVGACVLPPLTAALLFISQSGNVVLGALAMFAFGLGMGLPLVAIGFSAGWLLPKAGAWMERIKGIFGLLLIAAAIYLASRLLSETLILGLWGLWLIGSGLWLGALKTNQSGTALALQAVGIAVLAWGLMALWGAAQGHQQLTRPLAAKHTQLTQTQNHPNWQTVRTLAALNTVLQTHPKVMVDTYADWCIPCKVMEREVFAQADVQEKLNDYHWVQLDVTADNADDKAIKKALAIINPPTVMFFQQGQELRSLRLTGEASHARFVEHINQLPR